MTEAQLIAEIGLSLDRVWGMVEWWASVTFAVLLAAHLGARQLNAIFVTVVILLYSLFSLTVAQVIILGLKSMFFAYDALGDLAAQVELSALATGLMGSSSAGIGFSLWTTLLVTYLSTVFYVIYCYRKKSHAVAA